MADNEVKVITLKELWSIFVSRVWLMILAAIVVVTGVLVTDSLTYAPKYESTAILYILQQNNETNITEAYDEFSLALKVVNDCTQLIKSHSVLDEVIEELHLDMSYNELYNSISITNPEDTRILKVRVESDGASKSKRIVDTVCLIGTAKITEAMGFEQVNFYEYGVYNDEPCNQNSIFKYLIAGLLGAVAVYAIYFVAFLTDDKIRTDEDIEKYLELSILGDIPNSESPSKKKYGYKYYRRSKYYSKYGEDKQ